MLAPHQLTALSARTSFPIVINFVLLIIVLNCSYGWTLTYLLAEPVAFTWILLIVLEDGEMCLTAGLAFQGLAWLAALLSLCMRCRNHRRNLKAGGGDGALPPAAPDGIELEPQGMAEGGLGCGACMGGCTARQLSARQMRGGATARAGGQYTRSPRGLPPPTAYGGGGASGGGGGAGYGGAQYMDPAQLSHRAMEAQYPGGDPYQQQATYREQQATYREQEATYRAALEQCRCAVREVGW